MARPTGIVCRLAELFERQKESCLIERLNVQQRCSATLNAIRDLGRDFYDMLTS
jgi:hypothetical protein